MKNLQHRRCSMERVCKRGHEVTGYNAIPKLISGRIYQQCRQCRNIAEVQRRKFIRDNRHLSLKNIRSGELHMS